MTKARAFLEVAVKKGYTNGHGYIADVEVECGDIAKALRHWKLGATVGCQVSVNNLMKAFRDNMLEKDELTQLLRAFQSSVEERKSKDRDDWEHLMGSRKTNNDL